jgi:hypothetical protein
MMQIARALVSLAALSGAVITDDCRNKLIKQFQYDGSQELVKATRLLQGLNYYPKSEVTGKSTKKYTPTGGTEQDFPRWLPSCSEPYPFAGGSEQLKTDPVTSTKKCPNTVTTPVFHDPIQKVAPILAGSEPEDFGCCDEGSQTEGKLRQLSLSPNARHQRRWEYYSLKNLKAVCEANDADTDESYGTLYFMSAMAKKKSSDLLLEQVFDDANVICIPKECHTPKSQVQELMEERAAECAKNFMNKCYYGLSPVEFTNTFENLQGRSTKDNWLYKVYLEDFGYQVFSSGFDPDTDSRLGGKSKAHAEFYTVIGSAEADGLGVLL